MAGYIRRESNIQNLKKTLKNIGKYEGRIGVPDGVLHDDSNVSLVQIGLWNEFGTQKIPERSFLRSSMRENKALIRQKQTQTMRLILRGELDVIDALSSICVLCLGLVRKKIYDGLQPPLSPFTIQQRYHDVFAKTYIGAGMRNETLVNLAIKNASKATTIKDIQRHIVQFRERTARGDMIGDLYKKSKGWSITKKAREKFVGDMVGAGVFGGIPLVHTGQFVQSLTYKVVVRG